MLAWLTKLLENKATRIGTVIHIGAGVGTELPVYQDLNCGHILAIEPDNILFKKLKTKAKRFDNVTVQQSWVSDSATERSATIFANPRFNSLLPANKMLLEHFPNVKTTETLQVKTQSFDDLVMSHVKQTDDQSNVLVLEVQGFETTLFQNSQAGKLRLFNWILVRTSEHVLFEGGASAEDVKKCLSEQGFELRLSDTGQLPFVEQYYELNTSEIQLKTSKDQLTKMSHEFGIQQQKLADKNKLVVQKEELSTQLEQKLLTVTGQDKKLQATLNDLQAELQSNKENNVLLKQTIETSKQELQDTKEQLEKLNEQIGESTALKQKVEDEVISLVNNNVEFKQQITDLGQSKQEDVNQIESLKIKLDDLTTQINSAKTEATELQKNLKNETHWHQENKKWAENSNKQCAELKQQLIDRQKSSDLALKLQMKSQVDLDDLREKYQTKHHNERKLVELIIELRQKLQQASEFYLQLQEHYPELRKFEKLNRSSLHESVVEAETNSETVSNVRTRKARGSKTVGRA